DAGLAEQHGVPAPAAGRVQDARARGQAHEFEDRAGLAPAFLFGKERLVEAEERLVEVVAPPGHRARPAQSVARSSARSGSPPSSKRPRRSILRPSIASTRSRPPAKVTSSPARGMRPSCPST